MRRGLLAILALALWPGWALAQGQAGAAPPASRRGRSAERPTMRFEWVREGPGERLPRPLPRLDLRLRPDHRIHPGRLRGLHARGIDLRGATVALDSGGGLVEDGLALGRAFRRLGLVTTVGRTVGRRATRRRRTARHPVAARDLRLHVRVRAARRRAPPRPGRGARAGASDLAEQAARRRGRRQLYGRQHGAHPARARADRALHRRDGRRHRAVRARHAHPAVGEPPAVDAAEELRRLRVHNADGAFGGTTAASTTEPAPIRLAASARRPVPAEGARGWTVAHRGRTQRADAPPSADDRGAGHRQLRGLASAAARRPTAIRSPTARSGSPRPAAPSDRINGVRMMMERTRCA